MELINRVWKFLNYSIALLLIAGCVQTNVEQGEPEGTEQAFEAGAQVTTPAATPQAVASPTPSPIPATNTPLSTTTAEPTPTATALIATTAAPSPTFSDPPATPTATASSAPAEASSPDRAIVVDHTSVEEFERIPDDYIAAASNLRMVYIDASVGNNINNALDCLSHPSNETAPNHCSRHEHDYPEFSVAPALVSWNRAGGYDRSNWAFRSWEGSGCGGWEGKVSCFFQMIEPVIGQYDVVSYQFSYLEVSEGSTIANQPGGFFSDNVDRQDVYDLEAFEAQYPDTTFIYWTTSLSRGIGTNVSETFNNQMRQYAADNGKPLFDVADILSHDPDGNPCYDNRDGVPYDGGNRSEDHPDDGEAIPAICPHYTTEVDGGHLGSVSTGKIRVAKAFWVLMARLAGWNIE